MLLSVCCRCLCYPDVLYKTIRRGSQHGIDVLRLLSSCKSNPTVGFATQWAPANATDARTACPYIPLGASAATLIKHMGPAPVLSTSRSRPVWAWADLMQFGEVHEQVKDTHGIWQELIGLQLLQMVFAVVICAPPCFLVMHRVMLCSSTYRDLQGQDRMIVCQHSVYATVFGLSMIPQTVLFCIAMFKGWTGDYLASRQFTALCGIFMATRAIMYLIEGSVRSVIKWSWLLVVHHELFFLIIVMALWTTNTAVLGIGLVLDVFACHEAPLYVALVAYRLRWPASMTQALMWFACVWYLITRVFQTILVFCMVVGFARMSTINTTPEFIVTVILFGALTFIQAYTLVIYHAMYRKLVSKARMDLLPPAGTAASAAAELKG